MCQRELLLGLKRSHADVDKILSVFPIPSFPSSKQLYCASSRIKLNDDVNLDMLPIFNVTPVKQFMLGVSAYSEIVKWGRMAGPGEKIIFTFNITVPPGVFVLRAARRIGARIVAMVYDVNVPGETVPQTLPYRIDYWQHRKILRKYDGLVVITDAIARDFAPGTPYLRVEGGIKSDLVEQYRAIHENQQRDANHFTVVAAGRLDEANGIKEILGAFSLLEGDRYRLHIAGTGPLENTVREAAGRDHRIRYHGFIPFEEVLSLYATADVLVNMRLTQRLNTRYFFPSKTMEYMASGVPVITTCPGNMAEEYGAFTYLLHEETPEALADMILSVDTLPVEQRNAKGLAARQYIVTNKTWDAQAGKIVRFLEGIIGTRQVQQ